MSIRKKIIMGLLALGVVFGFGSGIARVAYGAGRCHSQYRGDCDRGGEQHGRHGWHGRWNRWDDRGPREVAPPVPAATPAPAAPAAAPSPTYVLVPYPQAVVSPVIAPAAPGLAPGVAPAAIVAPAAPSDDTVAAE